jgi:hypothetical protein
LSVVPRRPKTVQLAESCSDISQFSCTHSTGAPTHGGLIFNFHTLLAPVSRQIQLFDVTHPKVHASSARVHTSSARVHTQLSRSAALAGLTSFPRWNSRSSRFRYLAKINRARQCKLRAAPVQYPCSTASYLTSPIEVSAWTAHHSHSFQADSSGAPLVHFPQERFVWGWWFHRLRRRGLLGASFTQDSAVTRHFDSGWNTVKAK